MGAITHLYGRETLMPERMETDSELVVGYMIGLALAAIMAIVLIIVLLVVESGWLV